MNLTISQIGGLRLNLVQGGQVTLVGGLGPTFSWEPDIAVAAGLYTFTDRARAPGAIAGFAARVGGSGGGLTVTLLVNGVPLAGLTNIAVSGTATTLVTPIPFLAGDRIQMAIAIASGAPSGAVVTLIPT